MRMVRPHALTLIFLCVFHAASIWAQEQPPAGETSGSKVFAGLDLFFSLLDVGSPQPNATPALDSQFGYQFGAGQVGFWGSSRRFGGDDDYLKYSVFTAYKIQFSGNASLRLQLDLHQFTTSKLGAQVDIEYANYGLFLYQQNNWLGKNGNRTEIGGRVAYKTFWDLDWPVEVSSVQNTVTAVGNYFSVHSGLSHKYSEQIRLALMARYVTLSASYNIDGFPFVYLRISGRF